MNWTLYSLQENFRCASAICDTANALMTHQPGRLPKSTVSATGQTGEVIVKADGFETDDQEAHEVACDIMHVLNLTRHVKDMVHANDCAVLVRTNFLVEYFRGVLKAHGLPVKEKAKPDLPTDWQRAKASLAFLANPDNDRLAYIAIKLASGQPKADAVRRQALAEYKTINDLALHMHFPALTVQEAMKELAKMNVSRESLARIAQFAELLPPDSPVNALGLVMARETIQEDEGSGVSILTGHAAKGREFDAVWCPCWESETIPGSRKGTDEAEERRLAFVMLTRARTRVWLSWAKKRASQWGPAKDCTASRFLKECVAE